MPAGHRKEQRARGVYNVMPIDTALAIERCEPLLKVLDPQQRLYLEVALREAGLMQLVRQVANGEIEVLDDGDDDE